MHKTITPMRAVAVMALATLLGSGAWGPAQAKETPENDCLIGVQDEEGPLSGTVACTECDANCDLDGQANGQCTFKVRGCLNLPSTVCTARALKKVSIKTKPKRANIVVTPVAGQASSVCGSFVDVVVPLKKKGKKAGKLTINAKATADVKPPKKNKDSDKVVLQCNPLPAGQTCATTTTTTTTIATTTTTTTTLPPLGCGNGVLEAGEECEPGVFACDQGETCMPAGSANECKCLTCTAPVSAAELIFTTGTDASAGCGEGGLPSDAQDPTSGTIEHTLSSPPNTAGTTKLGAGCLYIGGGGSIVPGGRIPDASVSRFALTQECGAEYLLGPRTAAQTNSLSCTTGISAGKACFNNLSNWPNLQSCTTAADCPLTGPQGTVDANSCVDKPNCLFGPPLPILGAPSTCVVNTIGVDVGGFVNKDTGAASVNLPLRTHTFVTGNDVSPCPRCENSVCTYGARAGLACTPVGTLGTTIECPPSADGGALLQEFVVDLSPLTTGTTSRTEVAGKPGIFCPGQDTELTGVLSAFGTQNAGLLPPELIRTVHTISETGFAAGSLTDELPHAVQLASVFCIPSTGSQLIDGAASLPGPGAVTLPGTIQLQ